MKKLINNAKFFFKRNWVRIGLIIFFTLMGFIGPDDGSYSYLDDNPYIYQPEDYPIFVIIIKLSVIGLIYSIIAAEIKLRSVLMKRRQTYKKNNPKP